MSRITLTTKDRQLGDQTWSYAVYPEIVTVKDIINYYNEKKEAGNIYGISYNKKNYIEINSRKPINLPEDILSKNVCILGASGGWGRMDFRVHEVSSIFFNKDLLTANQ